jgi:hypothetical protein
VLRDGDQDGKAEERFTFAGSSRDGSLLFSDDGGHRIRRVSYGQQ